MLNSYAMKNLFAIYKKNNDNNFEKFVIRKISTTSAEKLDEYLGEGEELQKKKFPSQWLGTILTITFFLGIIIVVGYFTRDEGFEELFKRNPYMFFVGIALFLFSILIFFFIFFKGKKALSDPEVKEYVQKVDVAAKESLSELNVPETAVDIDVLFMSAKTNKKGEEKPNSLSFIQYINQNVKVFVEEGKLCFADSYEVIAIPVESVIGIKTINKRMLLPEWNKAERFNGPSFKKYKLYIDQNDFIHSKPYYEVDLQIEGEPYYFLIPCYEKEAFSKLFDEGLKDIE